MTLRRAIATLILAIGAVAMIDVAPASAACHSFTIDAPGSVREGETAVITVRRDGNVQPSSVRVRTIDGTATAPSDYPAVDTIVSFTGTQLSRSFGIPIVDDTTVESPERFSVHLSDGAGCNNEFSYGPDRSINIPNEDLGIPTTTTTSPPTTTTSPPTTTTTSTTVASTSSTLQSGAPPVLRTTTSTTTADTTSTTRTVEETSDGGSNAGIVALLVVAILAVGGGGGYWLYRNRSAQRPPPGVT